MSDRERHSFEERLAEPVDLRVHDDAADSLQLTDTPPAPERVLQRAAAMKLEPPAPATQSAPISGQTPNREIIVPLWPYAISDGVDAEAKKKGAEHAKASVFIFLVIWMLYFWVTVVHSFNYGLFQIFKALAICLIPMFALLRGTTHLRLDAYGLYFESDSFTSKKTKKTVPWNKLKRIHLKQPHAGNPMSSVLCLEEHSGKVHKLKLAKIPTAQQWRRLMEAVELWSPVAAENAPKDLLDSLSDARRKDPSYTMLWLDALSAPPKRERLQPLAPQAVLNGGRYEVQEAIGAGGQGTAYLARAQDGGAVVLKEYILPVFVDVRAKRQALEKFQHEAQVLSSLNHPNIVQLTDFFVEDHRAYLVLEYIDGPSLARLVEQRGPISQEDAMRYALVMCDILQYLHSQSPPIVHRDFTPDNMILTRDGTLKLIDFMVAQNNNDDSAVSMVVGKHAYMPPEQFRGKANAASDVYALGATLYFCLTGQEPEPLGESHPIIINDNVSKPLNDFVARCTALSLDQRYRSADEARAALQAINQPHDP